jgi:hypothetical protein
MVVMGWGVQMSGRGLGTESRCWRCLQEPVPDDDDHIGLCGLCISSLQDSPRRNYGRGCGEVPQLHDSTVIS